ncbi:integrase catalytic domain-containing protein [Trichonephila clavata]|uniref:Integrase catalytic domain-containing protein n=1 Tax=Trichonephila clavata TaxID=2740835 RepID=A0A8X6G597_TRICU|nr:integrase catalytic domain-containing protein [Trichonephila clavata]
MDKLNRSKRAFKGTITKLETFVEESRNHTPTKLDIKLNRVQEMNRKIDELKDQYYETKDISDAELAEIEADLQEMEDRLEDLEVRIRDILNSLIAKSSVSSVHSCENEISRANSKQKKNFRKYLCRFLEASLQGDAKLLETVDDSFESLIKALKTRFENKRLLTETHINAILEIEKISESARDIRYMTDILNKSIRALKLLGFERNNLSDLLLFNIILKKIDRETRKQFEQSIESNEIPELDEFIMFLEKRSQTIDSINRSSPVTYKQKQVPFNKSKNFLNSHDSLNSCVICKLPHLIYKCSVFQNMKVSDRFNHIKSLNLCINCLKERHKVKDCKSKNSCSVCKKRHHTSLHIFEAIPSPRQTTLANELHPPAEDQRSTPSEHCNTFANSSKEKKKNVLLPTAIVHIKGGDGQLFPCKAILDSGSHLSFIRQRLANKLTLKKEKINASVSGLGEIALKVKQKVNAEIQSKNGGFSTALDLLIVPFITTTSIHRMDTSEIKIPSNIDLADKDFGIPGEIDLLIGCELFFELLRPNQLRSPCEKWLFQETVFGYIVVGSSDKFEENSYCGLAINSEINSDSLNQQLRAFWEIETVDESSKEYSLEEEICETQYQNTHYRNEEGRYVVQLPFKKDPNCLGIYGLKTHAISS